MKTQVWLVTGASRGLGRAVAEAALRSGHRVVATAPRAGTLGDLVRDFHSSVHPIELEGSDPARAAEVLTDAIEAFGRLDVLVHGAEEDGAPDVTGVTNAALPHFRRARGGHVIQLAEGLPESLVKDLASLNVKVTVVERDTPSANPVRAAKAIVQVASVADPPPHLRLGAEDGSRKL
ncbi:MAG TPA: SDR family NAD(P)-dependent oxidoreductase [Planctomycetota bacterium]|nr:SDR family NAD(P)-dependent oxidoreductase [Planctomycetota bacterium]